MRFWRLPAWLRGAEGLDRVPREPFDVAAEVEQIPRGLQDPLQPLVPELWHDYWAGPLPLPDDAPKTGSVAAAMFLAGEGTTLVVRVQCDGEQEIDYMVDLDLLAERIVVAHLVRTGRGPLQRARLRAGEVRQYAARLRSGPPGIEPDSQPPTA
jgi:hypothetical protein